MSITKKDISRRITNNLEDISYDASDSLIKSFFLIVSKKIKTNAVKISGFGTFKNVKTKKRLGRNPKTLENFEIKEKIKPTLQVSKKVKKQLN